ncbi:MAG: primase [Ferruginibacter sp.]|uniref:toprim domain-containing protein n=1 Tax=Ferruginibacter sp. TaxID=1940288 RepID=UPI0026594EB6|nr:toprim domain-containing protein [Ferruginibacter sp.]MDB5276142.1 primase [Ferruginibacter sp.]
MKNNQKRLTCLQVKAMDIVEYLKASGYEPQKIKGQDYWYLSPLRKEKKASFKVNRRLNRWYDHGIGKGGNLVDFAVEYYSCSINELLQRLECNFSFHQPNALSTDTGKISGEPVIQILKTKPIHSPALLQYIKSRNIPIILADKYCREIDYKLNDKIYYSIGFLNDAGGYEMRNAFCKNSGAPKAVTTIKNGAKKIAVFEGFFDFLSFVFLLQNYSETEWDFCILNSLSFFEKSRSFLEQYEAIHLFLDNDVAGQNCSRSVTDLNKKYIDESSFYAGYKDLNEWIVTMGKLPKSFLKERPP